MLAMLCLAPGEPLERGHVSRLLWPGRFQPQARARLRRCLLRLDRLLTPIAGRVLDVTRDRIAIDPAAIGSDLADLEIALAGVHVAEALRLLADIGDRSLLDGMEAGHVFHNWLPARREQVERRLTSGTERALAALGDSGDAQDHARLADAWRSCGRGALSARGPRPRLAILPFEQHDAIGEPFFLADGVVDELSFRLGGIGAPALVGRTSVVNVVGGGRTLPEIGAALGVSHLIEGEVHRFVNGIRVSVSVRLIDARSDTEIWSDRYDGTIADAMSSRHVIGSHLLAGLCTALGIEAPPVPRRRMTTDRGAYALYLQGRALTMRTIGDDVIAKAIDRLERALRIDPDFAECWAALAEAHLYSATFTPAAGSPAAASCWSPSSGR
ncbi:hypothetical protein [Sphingomonas sp.]|uniref:hypothetical protein n=1 Tax=Sphingomonas sp. TaxID=28214 RepID=UPI002DD66E0E|nr:hypothetical protein [Sphingomonas sp.]